MRATLFAALLALAACKHTEPGGDAEGSTASEQTPAASPGPGPAAPGPAGTLHARLMIPPTPGQSRFVVEGCATTPDEPPAETRALPEAEKVEASALGNGIVVSHVLAHACCLKAETSAVVDGAHVTITETLSGTPCRCMCSSTLRTAVGLPVGTWDVQVRTVEPGKTRTAWSGELTVQ